MIPHQQFALLTVGHYRATTAHIRAQTRDDGLRSQLGKRKLTQFNNY